MTNFAGNQVGLHQYYPYGKELTALQEGDRRKWAGHERDLLSLAGDGDNLDYMHARHYSPVVGRFLNVDPKLVLRASRPQSWNRYSYAWGSPLKFIDPDGRDVEIAPIFAKPVEKGLRASPTFAGLYEKLKQDKNIQWAVKPMQGGKANARAYSSISVGRGASGVSVTIVSYIPLRRSWQDTVGLIGHEGAQSGRACIQGPRLSRFGRKSSCGPSWSRLTVDENAGAALESRATTYALHANLRASPGSLEKSEARLWPTQLGPGALDQVSDQSQS